MTQKEKERGRTTHMSIEEVERYLFLAENYYKTHYLEHMSHHLSSEQKMTIAKRISDLTLRSPIWLDHNKDYRDQFPEVSPYVSDGVPLSGLYLVGILKGIIEERYRVPRS